MIGAEGIQSRCVQAEEGGAVAVARKESTITWDKRCTDCGHRYTDSMTSLMGVFPVAVRAFKVPTGLCPECQKAADLHYEKLRSARDLHWTFDSVKEHFTKNPPVKGQELIVLDTSWGMNTYTLVTVESPAHTKQKRIVIQSYSNGYSGQSFYRSGKNCFSPKGRVRLLPYHSVIGDLVKKSVRKTILLTMEEVFALVGEQ